MKFIIYSISFIFILSCSFNKVVIHHGVHFLEKKHQKLSINTTNKNDILEQELGVITKEKPEVKKPNMYAVVLINDDYTPMEFVVYVLQIFFGFDGDKAQQIMLAVHTHGKGVCGIFTKEVAETKSAQVNNFAKENGHPLLSDIEEVDEDD